MMRWLTVAGVVIGAACAQAQYFGFPPGVFDGRAALDAGASAPSYTGPGDVVSGAVAWWGLRCYNAAYSGNVARVKDSGAAHTTTISCAGNGVITTSGDPLGTTCGTSCTVDVLYDQSGASSCSGACDLTQTTEADRPKLITSCQNGLNCLQWAPETTTSSICNSTGITQGLPFTTAMVAVRTNASGQGGHLLFSNSGSVQIFFRGASSSVGIFSGSTTVSVTASDNALHSLIIVDTGNSSTTLHVDDTTTASGDAGAQSMSGTVCLSSNGNNATSDTFKQMELGVWNGDKSSSITALTANQKDATSGWSF